MGLKKLYVRREPIGVSRTNVKLIRVLIELIRCKLDVKLQLSIMRRKA